MAEAGPPFDIIRALWKDNSIRIFPSPVMMTAADDPVLNPEDPGRLRPRFGLILALSALFHVVLIIASPNRLWAPDPPVDSPSISVEIVEPPPPAAKPEPKPSVAETTPQSESEAQHLPRHNAEKTDLRGTDFDTPVDDRPVAGEQSAPQPKVDASDKKTQIAEGQPDKSSKPAARPQVTSPASRQAIPEPKEKKAEQPRGMDALSDKELAGAKAGSLQSDLEKRRIQMVNRFLERMQVQVNQRFRRPLDARPYEQGVISFELDPSGYLLSARITRSSGNVHLDANALQAIRAVPRFEVPDSRMVAARYYRRLTFRYTGE